MAARPGGNPFEGPANASQPYTTPDGAKYGQCQYCGHCQRFGCEANAKGSAHISVIPFALRNPNFELRTHAWVTKVNLDSTRKKAVGVTYTDVATGEEYDQPASIVIVCAYAINNVHLLLLSGIGRPYDPTTGKGTVGKNYCYQVGGGVTLFFEDKYFNPFMGAGAQGTKIDDFHVNEAFDKGKYGFIGGATIGSSNDFKAREFAGQRSSEIAKSMNATITTSPNERRDDFSLIPYQSTHNTGAAIMGTDPSTSVVNRYLQSWDVSNVFVVGASAFPHNSAYNPTGPLGALTYLTADAIKNRYIKRPGRLICIVNGAAVRVDNERDRRRWGLLDKAHEQPQKGLVSLRELRDEGVRALCGRC